MKANRDMHLKEESIIYIWHKFQLDTCMFSSIFSWQNLVPDFGSGFRSRALVSGFIPSLQFGVSSDMDGSRGALKRGLFFHTFLCVLVWICNQTSSNQHLLVVSFLNFVYTCVSLILYLCLFFLSRYMPPSVLPLLLHGTWCRKHLHLPLQ